VHEPDRKMFAPIFRGPARSPESEVYAALGSWEAGATAATLADWLLRSGLAVGLKAPVTKHVADRAHPRRPVPRGEIQAMRRRRAR
jgi:hypothetical protein